uniref:Uncharacterized protein n=1 Tax=Parastrongyloides trichosuri TaxID=131310 RepID=A0A0N4Z6Y6_PARTI
MTEEAKACSDCSGDSDFKAHHSLMNSKTGENNLTQFSSNQRSMEKSNMNDNVNNNYLNDDFSQFPNDMFPPISLDNIQPSIKSTKIPMELIELEGFDPNGLLFDVEPKKRTKSIFAVYRKIPSIFPENNSNASANAFEAI